MNKTHLELYWSELPIGKENAADYNTLCGMWGRCERVVRKILHDLSHYDNGDDFVLIRSSKSKGFYKTDNKEEIVAYRRECLSKGRSVFAPVKKCNRILRVNTSQVEFFNNLRVIRESNNMRQNEVCNLMRSVDRNFDVPLLSKMENGVCLPTFAQLTKLAEIYGVEPSELVCTDLHGINIFDAI